MLRVTATDKLSLLLGRRAAACADRELACFVAADSFGVSSLRGLAAVDDHGVPDDEGGGV
jgi:hypothetical protein